MLRYAWFLRSEKFELECYEYLGLYYFYKGQVLLAGHYHNKMTNGLGNKNLVCVYFHVFSVEGN